MNDQPNSNKGFLKGKLEDYQVNPPAHVWDAIASQLGGRGRRSMIIITLSAAASLALAVTLGITFFGQRGEDASGIAGTIEQGPLAPSDGSLEPGNMPDRPVELTLEGEQPSRGVSTRRPGILEEKVVRSLEELAVESPAVHAATILKEEPLAAATPPVENGQEMPPPVVNEEPVPDMEGGEVGIKGIEDPLPDPEEIALATDPGEITVATDPATGPLQELPVEPRDGPRWIVGAALSPLYSFRDAEANVMSGAADFESGMIAYAGGVNVSYRAASRLAIETGVFYNKMGVSIGAEGIQLVNQSIDLSPVGQAGKRTGVTTVTNSIGNIVAISGEVYVNNYKLNAASESNSFTDIAIASGDIYASDQGIRQHLDYLELPFNLRYTVVDRIIELQLVGGISTNFLVNNYVTMETAAGESEIGYLTNIRSVNYSGNAGLGMVYHLHEKISLHMEPRFRYFLNSVNDNTLPSTRPYAIGFYTGLSYTF